VLFGSSELQWAHRPRLPQSMGAVSSTPALPVASASDTLLSENSSKEELLAEIKRMSFLLGDKKVSGFYDFSAKKVSGETVNLSAYRGKTVLVVNVASM